jgi:hypothetical protein
MSHVTSRPLKVSEIAAQIGLSVRQLQRRIRSGTAGVQLRTDGYHHTYVDCPELRQFMREAKRVRKGRRPGRKKKKRQAQMSTGLRLLQNISAVNQALRRNRPTFGNWRSATLEAVQTELHAFGGFSVAINATLNHRARDRPIG